MLAMAQMNAAPSDAAANNATNAETQAVDQVPQKLYQFRTHERQLLINGFKVTNDRQRRALPIVDYLHDGKDAVPARNARGRVGLWISR